MWWCSVPQPVRTTSTVRDLSQRRPLVLLLVAAVSLLAGLLSHTISAQAAEPGLSPDLSWGTSGADQQKTAIALRDIGSHWVRLNVEWRSTETSQGHYDSSLLSYYDDAVDVARSAGQRVLMLVSQSPGWASGSTNKEAPPKDPATYAAFVHFLASRWAGKVDAWEVWNEPNISRFWPTGPNPAAYTALLKAAYPAIKSADPGADVVFGGPSTNDYDFIEGAYAAGAKGYFDVMATHPYTCGSPESVSYSNGRISKGSFLGYREIHNTMLAQGDDKPIWLTEFGWSTTTESCGVGEATQADYLTKAFQLAAQDPYVQVAFYYNLRNNYWSHDADTVEAQYGLMRTDFSHKPSYDAFKACASGGCGAPTPAPVPSPTSLNLAPVVTLSAPAAAGTFTDSLTFRANAGDDKRVAKVEFWLDGKRVATDTSGSYSYRWKLNDRERKRLSYGNHTATAKAFDAEGLVGTDSVTVRRSRTAATARHRNARRHRRHATTRRLRSKVLSGRVVGARSGRVTVTLQSYSRGHWRKDRALKTSLKHAAFSARTHLRHGLWRLRATYSGSGQKPLASKYARFTI